MERLRRHNTEQLWRVSGVYWRASEESLRAVRPQHRTRRRLALLRGGIALGLDLQRTLSDFTTKYLVKYCTLVYVKQTSSLTPSPCLVVGPGPAAH